MYTGRWISAGTAVSSCKKENIEFIRLNEDIFFQGWDFLFFLNIKKKRVLICISSTLIWFLY